MNTSPCQQVTEPARGCVVVFGWFGVREWLKTWQGFHPLDAAGL
ncbi:hypothetical protein THTE_4056 [Thermogutta terrifontis]|uniref:Uncharacterized protein n=1 Tax=Thermogutta terrifontis TaxID=1331910 RepID=A0A286RL57_9BACT|nr:hypothetical protein THTE_4056 [Thermogutta terrifontis]